MRDLLGSDYGVTPWELDTLLIAELAHHGMKKLYREGR